MERPNLFSPITINGMELANRVIMSPMFTNSAAADGFVSRATVGHYVDRARSGVGLIMTEHTSVSSRFIHGGNRLQISRDAHVPGLARLVEAVHREGCKIGLQIAHSIQGVGIKVEELTNAECYAIIDDFAEGARRAVEAGFDAVELHYAHTYTMADFISRRTNTRTDEFGGDIYDRMFIHLEILKKVRALVGPDYPLFARISAEEFVVGGNTIVQSRIFAKELVAHGIDCMDVSAGVRFDDAPVRGYSDQRGKPGIEYPDGPNVYLAEDIKRHVDVPVVAVGKLGNPDFADEVIASGRADLIALARPLIADSMWLKRVRDGRYDQIKECLYCTECLYERHDPEAPIHCMRYTCQNACPAGVEAPIYMDLARQKRYDEAYRVVQSENPLVLVCGRVCNHPCEDLCNRAKIDDPVAIRAVKRFITDALLERDGRFPVPDVAPDNGRKIAVIGSGPSGLSCAFYLRKKGYSVTVFEEASVVGGMLALGLPAYRLPRDLFEKELDVFRAMGVRFETDRKLGRDFSLDGLRDRGYVAIYLAVGTHGNRRLGIPGEDREGVLSGVAFLRAVNLGEKTGIEGKETVVIGGGNVAVDCARAAIRLGASSVTAYCLEQPDEMPAHKWEVEAYLAEKGDVQCGWGPMEILGEGDGVSGVRFRKCLSVFDGDGRFNPVCDDGQTRDVKADAVIVAIGQSLETSFQDREEKEIPRRGPFIDAAYEGRTDRPYLFAGGDAVTGPDSVVRAVQGGKLSASSIDRYLGGDGQVVDRKIYRRELTRAVDETPRERTPMVTLPVCDRGVCFDEIESGYTEEQMIREAGRCLRCDVLKVSRL
ncbi:FAD-dependent oxidoreductase [Aminirod propionatiphilus]|uniref:FAD-dependent oxidoreductase n=1 Tax=Aminirod propionatiphilus TaxID=3415223 RepID=A0ACD1DU34_9BACT|nr:FAD-dependent oxidoreductase [Synergistota bacterium]